MAELHLSVKEVHWNSHFGDNAIQSIHVYLDPGAHKHKYNM